MTDAPRDPPHLEDPDDVAARWYGRKRSGEMTTHEEQALDAWLEADPAHRSAFDAVERAWAALGAVRSHPRVIVKSDEAPGRRFRSGPMIGRAMAASVALGALGVTAALAAWLWSTRTALATQTFHTGIGERATVSLPDGSVVTLNTDTLVRTRADHDRRLVYLERGQAFFKVAHDAAHPFVVAAAGRTVTAVGTAFDVRADARRFEVTLVEGKVRVETPTPPAAPGRPLAPRGVETTEMVAGSQLVATDDRRWSVSHTDVVRATAWIHDQLIFEAEPLSEVVEEMNRYSIRKIVIADPKVAATPVSGNFRPGDVEGFARAVEAYNYAHVARESDGEIDLSAPAGG